MKEIAGAIAGFAIGMVIIGPAATWLFHRAYDSLEPLCDWFFGPSVEDD